VAKSFEMISYCNATWHHDPEDCDLHLHHCENLKPCSTEALWKLNYLWIHSIMGSLNSRA
jgi:hypothetical protein